MNIIKTNLEFNSNKTKRAIESIKRIILHNSGVTVLQSIEIIHNYHKNTRGYAGIGYHFYIRKDGSTYEGRPVEYIGAHAGGNNSDSIGICFEGDYNQETMSEAQIKAGQELVAYLKNKYNITKVQRHSDVCNTSCPGKNFPFEQIANATANAVADTTVLDWQKVMNRTYGCNLAEDNCFGKDCRAKANKYYLHRKRPVISNEHVKFIQTRLCKHGFNVAVDGKFGPDCEKKAKAFQASRGLKQDGYVGADTTKELFK